jgi:hypothetical protein
MRRQRLSDELNNIGERLSGRGRLRIDLRKLTLSSGSPAPLRIGQRGFIRS